MNNKLVRELYEIRAEKKALADREAEVLAELALQPGTRFASGPYLVEAKPTLRFNEALAKEVLNKTEYARICKQVPQSAIAKSLFPERYNEMQKTLGATVTVKLNEEVI